MVDEQGLNGSPTKRRVTARAAAGCALAVVLAATAVPADAQDSRDVQALTQKIERLQGELNDLQRHVYGGESQPRDEGGSGQTPQGDAGSDDAGSGAAADGMTQAAARRLRERMESLETDIRRLTNQLQETQHKLQKTTKRVDKLVTDVDYRLRELEDFRKKAAAQLEGIADGPDGQAAEGDKQDGDAAGERQGGTQTAEADGDDDGRSASGDGDDAAGASGATGDRSAGGATGGDGSQGADGGGSGTIGTVSQDAVDQLREQAGQSAQADGATGNGADAASNGAGSDGDGSATSDGGAGETQTASKPSGSNVLPDGPPADQYDHAFKLLRERNYAEAEKAMRAFVEAHPEHRLAGNAKYWLGETYFVRGKYNQAAVAFAEGFRTYPDSRKAPDNLLKLGITLAKIDKVKKACRLFSELQQRFPDAAQNIQHRAKRERKRLGCGSES